MQAKTHNADKDRDKTTLSRKSAVLAGVHQLIGSRRVALFITIHIRSICGHIRSYFLHTTTRPVIMHTVTTESLKSALDSAVRDLRNASVLIADNLAHRLQLSGNLLRRGVDFSPEKAWEIRGDLVSV